jgi:hypothetical protein
MTPNRTTKNSNSETKYRYRDYGTPDERRVSNIADCNSIQQQNQQVPIEIGSVLEKIEKQRTTKIKKENKKKKKYHLAGSVRRLYFP